MESQLFLVVIVSRVVLAYNKDILQTSESKTLRQQAFCKQL